MYSKEESKALKQEFWTTFGKWSLLKRKRHGKGRWLLNKSGVKGYRFKFEAERKQICVCLEIIEPDDVIREIKYEKLLMLKQILDDTLNNEPVWEENFYISPSKMIVRVSVSKNGYSINNKDNWPEIFGFFYDKMSKFEEFFDEYKEFLDEE